MVALTPEDDRPCTPFPRCVFPTYLWRLAEALYNARYRLRVDEKWEGIMRLSIEWLDYPVYQLSIHYDRSTKVCSLRFVTVTCGVGIAAPFHGGKVIL